MIYNPSPKSSESIVPIFTYPINETIKLSPPDDAPNANLFAIIAKRRSSRAFKSLSMDKISNILWTSAKVKGFFIQDNGYILTQRPSPSGGARHPIDIILNSPILDNRKSFYYYNAFEHSINKLNLDPNLVSDFKEHIMSILDIGDGTIIWFVAHQNRTEAKYNNPLSLVWRDAGALIQCIQLACTSYNIGSCGVGSLGEPFISNFFSGTGNIFGTGGVIVG